MNSEKIIQLAKESGCHLTLRTGVGNYKIPQYYNMSNLISFYHAAIADFLKESGQYIANDASREYCIKQAKAEAFEAAAVKCEYLPVGCGLEGRTFADAIREMAKENWNAD